ncbi:MAG: flagellar hook-basal body protein [Anaerolineae bacterium]|nr:flagellar hook-basal body protein [Anaerolineae bacterium]
MNRGIYAVATGMERMLELQAMLSNNLANINTPAFKQEVPVLVPGVDAQIERVDGGNGTGATIGALGFGVYQGEHHLDLSQGPLEPDDNPLSLAISGDAFFTVQAPEGNRFTRDGSFGRDAAGYLVTEHGYRVLGDGGPIQLPDGDITVDRDGVIWAGNTRVARLALVRFAGPEALQRVGKGLFIGQNPEPVPVGQVVVYQGYLERSNVDITATLITSMTALKTYETSQRVFKMQDDTVARVLDLGRV